MSNIAEQTFIKDMINKYAQQLSSDTVAKELMNKDVAELSKDDIIKLLDIIKKIQFVESAQTILTLAPDGQEAYLGRLGKEAPEFIAQAVDIYASNNAITSADMRAIRTLNREYKDLSKPAVVLSNEVVPEASASITTKEIEVFDKIFQDIALAREAKYEPNSKAANYQARIAEKSGDITQIQASGQYVSIQTHDENGQEKVPDYDYFAGIAKLANQKKLPITFGDLVGDINQDEYKARLLIACLGAEPPVRYTNDPQIDTKKLELQTKTMLEELLNPKSQDKEESFVVGNSQHTATVTKKVIEASPSLEPMSEKPQAQEENSSAELLSKNRQARMKELSSIRPQSYMEGQELFYHKKQQEQEERLQGNYSHQLMHKGGYGRNMTPIGWSLELEFDEAKQLKNGTRLETYLGSINAEYQKELITNNDTGEQKFSYQLFLGKRDDAIKAIEDINKIIPEQNLDEDALHFIPSKHASISTTMTNQVIRKSGSEDEEMLDKAEKLDLVPPSIDIKALSSNPYHHYLIDHLEQYAAHKLYSKFAGTAYTGTDEDGAQDLEENIKYGLPNHELELYTKETKKNFAAEQEKEMWKYDEIADAYIKQMQKDNPSETKEIIRFAVRDGLDFSKKKVIAPPQPQQKKSRGKGR